MKIAYFDCPSGIAGNMILGALIDAGLPVEYLKEELKKLRISHLTPRISKVKKHGIQGTYFEVKIKKQKKHRRLKDILKFINQSRLSSRVKAQSTQVFKKLAEAESYVHGIPVNQVHFHEVGAVDSIVDIVGCAIGLEYFNIREIYCSPLNLGSGSVNTAHGRLPVPAPATLKLLKGIPVYNSGIKKELVTPTGAAIISTLAKLFGPLPRIKAEKIGFGAGSYNLKEQPNLLRIIIGEKEIQTERDAILQIEANIDDMNPQLYDQAIARLMKAGALDAYILPIRMKKQRNAVQLVVLCAPEKKEKILEAIFNYTTTLGTRAFLVEREILKRKVFKTKYGRIKVGKLESIIKTLALEPDDYLIKKQKPPVKQIYKSFIKRL